MDKVFNMCVNGTALIAAVLCFRHFFLRQVPKRFLVFLWALCLARLLLPVSVSIRWPGAELKKLPVKPVIRQINARNGNAHLSYQPKKPDDAAPGAGSGAVCAETGHIRPEAVLFTVWLIVAVCIACKILLCHIRSGKIYSCSLPIRDERAAEWFATHRSLRKVTLRKSDLVKTPLTYGVLRPVILMPSELDLSGEEFLCIMEHEWAHIRWWDVLLKHILCLAVCVYWFHPLVWAMAAFSNRDMEMACDEEAVRKYPDSMKTAYALTLIRLAEGKKGSFGPANAYFARHFEIEERIRTIMKLKKYSAKAVALAIGMTVCAATTFTAFARESAKEPNVNTKAATDAPETDVSLENVQKDEAVTLKEEAEEVNAEVSDISAEQTKASTSGAEKGVNTSVSDLDTAKEKGMESSSRTSGTNADADIMDANDTDENVTNENIMDVSDTDANIMDANDTDANITDANDADANITDANVTDKNVSYDLENEKIVKLAQKYIGAPYEFGGADLSTGVDSPGFVRAIYGLAGINLPEDIYSLAVNGTEVPISVEALSAGDILFYGSADGEEKGQPQHAGIYDGNGNVIHASNQKDGVKESKFNYRPALKAVRVL